MTQNSELDLMRCFVCLSNEFDQMSLNQNLLDASDFREVGAKNIGFTYVLTTCKKCGHSAIQTDNPCWMPTRKHGFISYGEPIEHYPKISSILRALNLDFKDISIHTFSHKDFQLANFLAKDLEIPDVNLNDHAGCSDDWLPTPLSGGSTRHPLPLKQFIAEIKNSEKSHQIILITRVFDHIANHGLLQKILGLVSPSRHIVFDFNDYDRLINLETLEYVWNERRNLLRRSHLESILQRSDLKYVMFSYESPQVSPTLTGVISLKLNMPPKSIIKVPITALEADLVEKLIALRQRWHDKLVKTHKLGVIGASHKGVSIAQFVLDNRVQYSLHDDKESLRGKTPPVDPPLGFHLVSGFDFSEYTHISITTTRVIATKLSPKLRAAGYSGEILDFDCQILD